MLSLEFFGQNFHFTINLLAALVCFAVFWLYFDAWLVSRNRKEIFKLVGFLALAVGFLSNGVLVENSTLEIFNVGSIAAAIAALARIAGYLLIAWGQWINPLQPVPEVKGLVLEEPEAEKQEKEIKSKKVLKEEKKESTAVLSLAGLGKLVLPVGALLVAWLYWRRATIGLERHLKPIAISFALLFIFELLGLLELLRSTTNPLIFNLVAPFGFVWWLDNLFLVGGLLVLGRWVWGYLVTRLQTQLLVIFTTIIMVVFLITTVAFTYLLLQNVQRESLSNLTVAAKVLNLNLESRKGETLAYAQALAADLQLAKMIESKDHSSLSKVATSGLVGQGLSSVVLIDSYGQVLARGEDPLRWGDSISSDSLIRHVLIGTQSSTFVTKDGVLAPVVLIKSAVPVRDGNLIVGAVIVGIEIDNSFVDGLKKSTGLESAVYAGGTRSATTFIASDGKSRWVGVKEENPVVKNLVLKQGKTFTGTVSVLNRQFLAAYEPLKNIDNTVVGMIFIGKGEASIFQTASFSIQLTFILTVILLVLSIYPSYKVSKFISSQIS